MLKTIQEKANGLHSGTFFKEFNLANGVRQQWHKHPETGELVIMETWPVPDGDCISQEFKVIAVYPSVGCDIAEMNVETLKPVEIIDEVVIEIK